jgi:deoxycytidylate deaminase
VSTLWGQVHPSILAELAVKDIFVDREQYKKDNEHTRYEPRRVCHIIDSIKNQQELDLLRDVYRESLYVVGVYAPLADREKNLEAKGLKLSEIYSLIDKDSGQEVKHGQTVEDTFPHSDYFLRVDSKTVVQLETRAERFLNLILQGGVITPTKAESAMYSAASASWNSACLSRQVGASITDANGELLATGWNDVPRPFGGLYTNENQNRESDFRCWNWKGGRCFNDEEKALLAERIVDSLVDAGISVPDRDKTLASVLGNKRLRGLIEFSRSIHAEMHAILNALKTSGSRVNGGKLFVTTYPCHACARHIVASGIAEVYYIEPYKKSLALKLHEDSLTESEADQSKVRVLPYEGVAPSRYLSLFRMQADSRKTKDGRAIKAVAWSARPKTEKTLESLPVLEKVVVQSLIERDVIEPPTGFQTKNERATDSPPEAA